MQLTELNKTFHYFLIILIVVSASSRAEGNCQLLGNTGLHCNDSRYKDKFNDSVGGSEYASGLIDASKEETTETNAKPKRIRFGQGVLYVMPDGEIEKICYYWNDNEYPIPIDYDWSTPMVKNKNWEHGIASLRWLYVVLYEAEDNPKATDLLITYLKSFYLHHYESNERKAPFFYTDHTWSIRLIFLAECCSFFEKQPAIDNSFMDIINKLFKTHISQVVNEGKIYRPDIHNNHQAMVHKSLYYVTAKHPQLLTESERSKYMKLSFERSLDQILHIFTKNGVTREHSPSYQLYNLGIVMDIRKLVEESGADSPELDTLLARAQEFIAYSILPDGTMPAIGDSFVPDSLTEAYELLQLIDNPDLALRDVLKNYDVRLKNELIIWPLANMAIIRKKSDENYSHIFFMASNLSKTHKHDDDLSFTYFTDGHRFIVDTGYDDFQTMHKSNSNISKYRNASVHNVIIAEKSRWKSRGNPAKTKITGYAESDNLIVVQGEHRRIPRTVVKRTLILMNNDRLYIIDQITSDRKQSFSNLLHIDPEIEVHREGQGFVCKKKGFQRVIIPISTFDQTTIFKGLDHSPPAFVFRDRKVIDSPAIKLTRDNVWNCTMKVYIAPKISGDIPDININGNKISIKSANTYQEIHIEEVKGEDPIRLRAKSNK